jgi:hypothetical protein
MSGLCVAVAAMAIAAADVAAEETPAPAEAAQTAAPTGAAPTPAAADPALLAELTRQLDDDRFAIREAAHQKLFDLGVAALTEVGRVAATGSLESSTRAVAILSRWASSADSGLSLAALEQMAALTNRPAEAAAAANRLAEVRERAAMEAIVELGGRIEFDRNSQVVFVNQRTVQVIFGSKWRGGLEGLRHLPAIRSASTVSFFSSSINGDEVVSALADLPQLSHIQFYGTKISDEAATRLREMLPNALVDVRGPARLGIAGPIVQPPGGAQVSEVQPGSAAERAGLMPNDLIKAIDGRPVDDFEGLTKEIATKNVGDSVRLTVMRSTPIGPPQDLEVTVKFAEWNDEQPVNPNEPSPLDDPTGASRRVILHQ